jgi:hypothetical protein
MIQKWVKSTRVNSLGIILESWGRENLIRGKPEQIMKSNSQLNTILNDEIEKISIKKNKITGLTC